MNYGKMTRKELIEAITMLQSNKNGELSASAEPSQPFAQSIEYLLRDERRKIERRYRELFKETPILYVTTRYNDGVQLIKGCNQMFLRSLGYNLVEVMEKPLSHFMQPDDAAPELPPGGGKAAMRRQILRRKDGTLMYTLMRTLPEYDLADAGLVVGANTMFLDITVQTELENRLRLAELRLQEVPEAAGEDTTTALKQEVGRLKEELHLSRSTDDKEVQVLRREIADLRRRLQSAQDSLRDHTGWAEAEREQQLEELQERLNEANTRLKQQRQEAEEALRMRDEEIYRYLQEIDSLREMSQAEDKSGFADALPFLMRVDNKLRQTLWLSDSWLEFTGAEREELFAAGWLEWLHPHDRDRINQLLDESMMQQQPLQFELRLNYQQSEYRWMYVFAMPRFAGDGEFDGYLYTMLDVHERKVQEEALLQSERKLTQLIGQSPIAIVEWNLNSEVTSWNPGAERIFGYSSNEAAGRSIWELTDPEATSEQTEAKLDTLLKGKNGYFSINRNVTKQGKPITCEWYNTLLTDSRNRMIGAASLIRDVTQEARNNEILRANEARFRALYDDIPIMYFTVEEDGHLASVNEYGARELGYDIDMLHSFSLLDVCHDADRERLEEQLRRCIAQPDLVQSEQLRLLRRNGEVLWISNFARAVKDDSSGYQVLLAMYDITRVKEAEETVEKGAGRYRLLADHSLDLVARLTDDGRFIYSSPAARQMLEYEPDNLAGVSLYDLLHTSDRLTVEAVSKRLQERSGQETVVARLQRRDGKYLHCRLTLKFIADAHPDQAREMILVVRDISAQKDAESALQKVREEFEARLRQQTRDLRLKNEQLQRAAEAQRTAPAMDASPEDNYRTLLDNASDGILITDSGGTIVDVNTRGCLMLGYSREEMLNLSQEELVAGGSYAREESYRDKLLDGETLIREEQLQRKDKTLLAVEISSRMLPDGRFIALVRDISERRRSEEALSRFMAILEATTDFVSMIDKQGQVLYMNLAGRTMLGIGQDEALDSLHVRDFHPRDVAEIVEKEGLALATRDGVWSNETIFVNRNKEELPTLQVLIAHKSPDGEVEYFSTIARNISDRKRAEKLLRESEERYRMIAANSTDMISKQSPKAEFTYVSAACRHLLGFTQQELVGSNLCTLIHKDDLETLLDCRSRIFREPIVDTVTFRAQKKDGKYIWLETTVRAIFDQETGLVEETIAVSREVTARKLIEEELRKYYDQLEDLIKARTQKLSGANLELKQKLDEQIKTELSLKESNERLRNMSLHNDSLRERERTRIAREIQDELGQVLAALQLDISWLENQLPKRKKVLFEKTKLMSNLIELTYQRVQRISQELRPEALDNLDFSAAISWQTREFERRSGLSCQLIIRDKNIILDKDVAAILFRIFQEVLNNVQQHAEASEVTVILETQNDSLLLSVEDNGRGITSRELNAPASYGLMGMRERVLALRGSIRISAEPAEGTTVNIEIPLDTSSGGGLLDNEDLDPE